MPRPISYLPQFASSVIDETASHHNIDKLMFENEKGYQEGGPAGVKQWSQEDLLDLVNLGEREYKDALKFWGRDTTLFDSLKQDIADTNIIVQELPPTDKRLKSYSGGRYAKGPYSKSPDLPFHPQGKANPEAVKDTIFVKDMGSSSSQFSKEEVLAHEFGHYFEPHYPSEPILSWIKNPIDAFKYFTRRHNPGLALHSDEQQKKFIKELEESGEFDDILKTPTSQATFNEMFFPVGTKYQLSKAKEKAKLMREAGYKLPEGLQHGGLAERKSPLAYMQPAIQDETAHDSMDRLMFENELEQQPQYSMGAPDYGTNIFGQRITEPFDLGRDIAEGAFTPLAGMAKLIKPGSSKIKGILSQLNMSKAVGTQSSRRGMVEALKRQRAFEQGALPKKEMEWMLEMQSKLGFTPKYKDAPQRAIEDIVIKLHNLEIPSKSVEMAGKARLSLDKILERIMKQYNKTGMVSPSNEKAAWESFRAWEEIVK